MKSILFLLSVVITFACNSQNTDVMEHQFTNDLIHETSPYLLQHAHNPVDWKPWNQDVLQQAKKENKLIIISVGYAACHWCHVMEHESFEDLAVAKVMNDDYISIKIDREERPDIDQVYMTAVQLMTGRGGWPLNVVALPDGRPIWGGTYYRKEHWIESLQQIARLHKEQPEKLVEFATNLEQGIQASETILPNEEKMEFEKQFINTQIDKWSTNFDHKKGGTRTAPKFMMPNNYHFLLRYAYQSQKDSLLSYVKTTLNQMSYGGVYDHVGGGFARYATDTKWHVPHFEKMLYDNAQLVSLYADAYLATKDEWYKTVVYETLSFVKRELTTEDGIFYSSLDADSLTPEGDLEEGAFYIWTTPELKTLLGKDFELFAAYYNINSYGLWEKENYVLIRNQSNIDFAQAHQIEMTTLLQKLSQWKTLLLEYRSKRNPPRLDDKPLTSWNALMLKGYLDAYRVFGDVEFLDIAIKNANFIKEKQLQNDSRLLHTYKNGKSAINGYLEDYATVIDSFIELYQNTFDPQWLDIANSLTTYTLAHFYDDQKQLFYFTSDLDPKLITRAIEYSDNVIPASNSIMAKNLFLLSHYFDNTQFKDISKAMLHTIKPHINDYPMGYSNWLDLMLTLSDDFYEIVIVGKDAFEKTKELQNHYIPNKLVAGSLHNSEMPLLKLRYSHNETLIYTCVNNACKYPVENVNEAIKDITKNNLN